MLSYKISIPPLRKRSQIYHIKNVEWYLKKLKDHDNRNILILVRNKNYLLPLMAVPVDEARDFAKENGHPLSSTLNFTKLELLYRQSSQGYIILFLRNK